MGERFLKRNLEEITEENLRTWRIQFGDDVCRKAFLKRLKRFVSLRKDLEKRNYPLPEGLEEKIELLRKHLREMGKKI